MCLKTGFHGECRCRQEGYCALIMVKQCFPHCLLKGLTGEAVGFETVASRDGVITLGEILAYLHSAIPDETQRVLGVAKHPIITTSTDDPDIWNLSLELN